MYVTIIQSEVWKLPCFLDRWAFWSFFVTEIKLFWPLLSIREPGSQCTLFRDCQLELVVLHECRGLSHGNVNNLTVLREEKQKYIPTRKSGFCKELKNNQLENLHQNLSNLHKGIFSCRMGKKSWPAIKEFPNLATYTQGQTFFNTGLRFEGLRHPSLGSAQ